MLSQRTPQFRLKMRTEIPKSVVHRCVPSQGSKKELQAGHSSKHSFQNILTFECDFLKKKKKKKKVSHEAGREQAESVHTKNGVPVTVIRSVSL